MSHHIPILGPSPGENGRARSLGETLPADPQGVEVNLMCRKCFSPVGASRSGTPQRPVKFVCPYCQAVYTGRWSPDGTKLRMDQEVIFVGPKRRR